MTHQEKRSIRVLLVDDEVEFLESAARALSRRGFTVTTAADGRCALTILQSRDCDVAVLDVKMPGIDGEQVFYEILRRWPSLPVVMLTGHGTIKQAFETSRAGLFDYLTKPCEIEELAGVLRSAVNRQAQLADPDDEERPPRVLYVHASDAQAARRAEGLRGHGMYVIEAEEQAVVAAQAKAHAFDVALLDLTGAPLPVAELLAQIKERRPSAEITVLAPQARAGEAVAAMRQGATDMLLEPLFFDRVVGMIKTAARRSCQRAAEARAERIKDLLQRYTD